MSPEEFMSMPYSRRYRLITQRIDVEAAAEAKERGRTR